VRFDDDGDSFPDAIHDEVEAIRQEQLQPETIVSSGLALDAEGRERLKQFHEDGLVWLINTALLHPRGYAIAIHLDDQGEYVGLSVVGDGSEPWVFGPNAAEARTNTEDAIDRYLEAEGRREATWSLRGEDT